MSTDLIRTSSLPVRAISTERLHVIVATLLRTSPDPSDPFITEAIRRGLVTPLVDAVDAAATTDSLHPTAPGPIGDES